MPDLPTSWTGPIIAINAFPDIAELYYFGSTRTVMAASNRASSHSPTGSAGVDPKNPASSVQINQISRSLEPPMTDEIIVGVERQIHFESGARSRIRIAASAT